MSARPSSLLDGVELVDHHCHGVVRRDLDRQSFEALLTEAGAGEGVLDSQIGFAVRRWCAPVLGLPVHSPPDEYLARRAEVGVDEVTRRLLAATGTTSYLVDGGFEPEPITSPAELALLTGATAYEIVRLEGLAEEAVLSGATASGFADDVRRLLWDRSRDAVAVKTIAAYRVGLDLSPERPSAADVVAAVDRWLASVDADGSVRCADEVLTRFLVWEGIDRGLPLQIHVGLGDSEVDLHRCDPLLLTRLLRATEPLGVPVMLLHNYPFHRHAGYLAQVFPHVYVDLGLATHNVGRAAGRVIAETLELAPFGKFLFSSDAFGLPELYHLGSLLFRRGLDDFLTGGVAAGDWSAADAARVARMIGHENARRAYRLEHS
ncbi:MAG: amidohydrolase family protein [Geodermatophilaceae bacterium]|nr:amidohydrolase family protein [Geodermatophilaceae bacterium]